MPYRGREGHWLQERSGSDSYCTVQLDEGRNDELTKDAKNALPRKRGSLAAGEVRLRLILHRSAGEGRNDELNECPGELERVIGNSSSEDELGRSDARKYSLWSASSRSDVDGFGDGDLNTSSDGDGYSSEDNLGRSNDRK